VRDVYRQWRPTPLFRARRLEQVLQTPARLYYKYEGVSPAGSHKPNTAVAQAFYNREAGIRKITTETGAGQWGSSLAFAGALFGIDIQIFMVRVSYNQKPYRRIFMETFGARASPARRRNKLRAARCSPGHPRVPESRDRHLGGGGARGHARRYEVRARLRPEPRPAPPDCHRTGSHGAARNGRRLPDIVVGCTGGGSNFAGIAFPFIGAGLRGGRKARIIAIEPSACPSLTRGVYAYDFGDTGKMTPLTKMHTLGSAFVPPGSMQAACATTAWRRSCRT
jgi:tryptophan synthase beta chain